MIVQFTDNSVDTNLFGKVIGNMIYITRNYSSAAIESITNI